MKVLKSVIRLSVMISMLSGIGGAYASDHDDGIADNKSQAMNLTDLYVFREDNQTGRSSDKKNLVLIMNSAPRSLPEQQYYFSPGASYQFHLTRVTSDNKNTTPTGASDIILSFIFGAQDANNQQPVTITAVRGTETLTATTNADGAPLVTTELGASRSGTLVTNSAVLGGETLTFFAGMREDPFFFDVEQFFKVRAGAAGLGPKVAFLPRGQAEDFTKGFNVNSIVLRVPLSFLQTDAKEPVFDVWQTVFVQ